MSVKIEILDYVYGEFEGTQMITNVSNWDLGTGWTISGGTAHHSGGNGYLQYNNINLIQGQTYRIKYTISGRTSGSLILANHLANNANGFIQNANGTFVYDWVQGGDNNDKLSLAGWANFVGSVGNVQVFPITGIDWDNSIVGELDIADHSDFPFAMTFQISDFKDLTSTSGDYSKTFKIPATKNNNNIFKHLYIPNISIDNTVTNRKSCRILFNNLYSLAGLIQVDGVGGYGETPSYYNCVFFGSNLNWADKIQDTYMNIIDWGDDGKDLAYNKDSIVATWQHEDCNNASNSPIVYPITSYGEYNALGTPRTIQLLDTVYGTGAGNSASLGYYGFYNSGNSYGTPTPVADWRPSVFVKPTLDKIFAQMGGSGTGGYKINSAFMETDMFKKLVWLLPNFKYNNPEQREIDYSYGNHFTGEGLISSLLINPTNNPLVSTSFSYFESVIDLNNAGSDFVLNANTDNTGWDATTGIFTVQEYGEFTTILNNFGLFATRVNFNGGVSSLEVNYAKIQLQVQTVGQGGTTSWVTVSEIQTGSFYDSEGDPLSGHASQVFTGGINETRYLNKDDKLRLVLYVKARTAGAADNEIRLYLFGSSTPTSATTSSNANGRYNIDINPLYVEYGQTYNLTDVMNPDYKQINFVKGIAHAFNLQMTTDESTKTVNIEPFDTFYKPYGDAVDWTYRLDRSSEISDKWLESDLKRTLVFKYKSDNADAKVKARGIEYFREIEDESPYREELPNTFKKGDSTFENPFFAGTHSVKDNDTTGAANVDTAYSACLWTENVSSNDEGRPTKGYNFLPRLLYWNKYSAASTASVPLTPKKAIVETWASITGAIVADATAGGFTSNIYPQATMINADSTTSPILSYGNVWVRDYDDATGVYTAIQTGKGLYDTYYRNMFESIKRSPRLRTVSISLSISDIIDLDFKKLVYIDGVYWRINKVIDYKPNNNESTKVELIEWFQIGVFAATAPMFAGGSNDWNVDGSVNEDNNGWGL
jgi:hypothetical protein